MMNKSLFFILLVSFIGCVKEEPSNTRSIERLEFNAVCGWCVGMTFMEIEGTSASLAENTQCMPPEWTTRTLSTSEISSLQVALSTLDLYSIDLNQCGECYDGCEEQLIVGEEENPHRIIFDNREYPALDELDDLLEVLKDIRDNF